MNLKVNNIDSYNYTPMNDTIISTLNKTKTGLLDILSKYSNEDREQVIRKTEFNECIHFTTLVPFLLEYDGKEERAITAYLTATVLVNEFFEKHYK